MRRLPFLALALAALVLAGCGDDDSSSTEETAAPATETTAAPAADPYEPPPETTAAPAGGDATVALAEVGDLGPALVNADGLTLYLFEQDDGTTSACTGGCADAWPALTVDGEPAAGEGLDAALLGSADGHVTYNGHLLYTFSGDSAPGDANGVGIPAWFPVDAQGNAIGA